MGAIDDARSAGGVGRSASRRRKAVFLAGYLLVVFLFFEGAARIALSIPAFRERIDNDAADVSWRIHWLRRHGRKTGIYYTFDQYDPTRGWVVRPNVRDLPAFPAATVNTNSQGARGLREYVSPKPAGVKRILVFGDSFTFGDEVPDDQTYSADLERALPGVEVVNLGVHGYGHDQMLLYLQEVAARYQPDVVLLGFVYMDMQRNTLGFRDYAKPQFQLVGDRLVLRNARVASPAWVSLEERYGSRFLDLLTLLYSDITDPRGQRREEGIERLTAAILDAFRDTARAAGATPIFAYLPIEGELGWPDVGMIAEERFFLRYGEDHGVALLDLRPDFMARAAAGATFKTSGHWTTKEHQVAADVIGTFLKERQVLR
jgi:GDSL-like Lipase/Acylhydrolase family